MAMAHRCLKLLVQAARKGGADRSAHFLFPWRFRISSGFGESPISELPLWSSNAHLKGQFSPLRGISPWTILVRAAANDALDIVRYLDGTEEQILQSADDVPESSRGVGGTSQPDYATGIDSARDGSHVEEFLESADESTAHGTTNAAEGEPADHVKFENLNDVPKLKPHADGMYRKIIHSIAHRNTLALAFENVQEKYGEIIFGSQESIDWGWCEQTADELRAGTYTFLPPRVLNVPILGSKKMRAIKAVNPKDQIILEAFRAALHEIYSPLFSPHVFGCKHTALQSLKSGWKGNSWFMEFSFEKRYDGSNQKRLKNILSEKIEDKCFLDTLFQMFNAGVIGLERTNIEEGGILSSILCKIYFQKLDEEVEAIKKEWNTVAKNRMINPAYRKLMIFDKRTLARLGGNAEQMRREKQHRLALARKMRISRKDYKDPNYTKVKYVRFGDNFLLGLSGSKAKGLSIMKRLTTFLQSNLQLQVDKEKTRLTHAVSDKTLFLGTFIRVLDPKELPEVSSALTRALARKRDQTMRVKLQLEDRWMRECRHVVLKCWTLAFEKWRRESGKDAAKRQTFEVATQQLLSMPEDESAQWRETAQDILHVFISAALRQGLFPKEEVDTYHRVLASLEQSLSKESAQDREDLDV